MQDMEPAPDVACSDVAEALQAVLDFVTTKNLQGSFVRFMALAWLMDPERYFEGRTETQVARLLGITKAAFSRVVRELSELSGIRNRYMKREGAIGAYSERQRRIWAERRGAEEERPHAQLFLDV